VIGPQAAQAQTPTQQQALQALQAIGVPCNAYSNGLLGCSGYNADNVYTLLRVHTDVADPDPTTLYVFDPYTGHSVHITITIDDAGNIHLFGTDSETGDDRFHQRLAVGLLPGRQSVQRRRAVTRERPVRVQLSPGRG